MKKALSLILALVLCLSLCACGGGNDTSETKDKAETNTPTESIVETTEVPETTEDPTVIEQKEKDYNTALNILKNVSGTVYPPDVKRAYELLSALGDYKDSAQYLSRISVQPNTLTHMAYYIVNVFGEQNMQYDCSYVYTADGKLMLGPGNPQEGTHSYYSYNEQGQLSEIRLGYGDDMTRVKHTYNYENGVLTSVDVLWDSGETEQHIYENGKLIRKTGKDYVGTFTYDENGNMAEERWEYTYLNNPSTGTYEYELDANGNVIRKTVSWYGGKYTTTTEYTYENGHLVKEEVTESQGNHYLIAYTYGDYYCYTPEA